jgi:hypothetical protein
LLQLLVFAALRLILLDFLLGFIGVSGVAVFFGQFKVVLLKLFIDAIQVQIDFLGIEIVFLAVLCPQFCAVSRDERTANQIKMFGQLHRGPENVFDGFGVVLAEVGNGVVVWLKFRHEPHEFQVAFAFLFELAAGADAVEVALNKKAEQSTGVVCRPAIFLVLGFKPKFSKVQAISKEINKAHLIVGIDMLI